MPYRDDLEAAQERVAELEREAAHRRVELDYARRRNTEIDGLRAHVVRLASEREQLATSPLRTRGSQRLALGALAISWFVLVAVSASSAVFRMRAATARSRQHRAEIARDQMIEAMDVATSERDEARRAAAFADQAALPSGDAPFATLLRARVTSADGSSWAEPGDVCTVVVSFGTPLAPCRASVRCVGGRIWIPALACDLTDRWPARLTRVRPSDDGAATAMRFDAATRSLVIRAGPHEPPVAASVLAILPFEPP